MAYISRQGQMGSIHLGVEKMASKSGSIFVAGGGNFEDGEEGFWWDFHLADTLHAALAFFLFFEEFAFAGNVAAVTLGKNILANRRDGSARAHTAAICSLHPTFKHLTRNQLSQPRHALAPAPWCKITMAAKRQRNQRL